VSARLFLRRLSVIAQSVAWPLASRVARALSLTPTDGSHVSAHVLLHASVSGKAFSGDRSDPSPGHASPGVWFPICHVVVEATLLPPAVPWTSRWRSLAQAIERHVRPLGCVPFPHAQTRLPASKEISLRVRRHAPFRVLLLLAQQSCFAAKAATGRHENCSRSKTLPSTAKVPSPREIARDERWFLGPEHDAY
jgi:hypothetical protein